MVNHSCFHSDITPPAGPWAVLYRVGFLSGREEFETLYEARVFCKKFRKLHGRPARAEIRRARRAGGERP